MLDSLTRWEAFLYASNKNYDTIIKKAYGSNIKAHEKTYQAAKSKVCGNIKAYKGEMLEHAEVRGSTALHCYKVQHINVSLKHLEQCFESNSLLINNQDEDDLDLLKGRGGMAHSPSESWHERRDAERYFLRTRFLAKILKE